MPRAASIGHYRPMIVQLTAAGAVVSDADDCTRLHLETSLTGRELRAALATTNSGTLVDDGNVALDLAVLRSRAKVVATAPDWAQRWTAMVGYAEKKGWLSDDGRAVQVHIERPAA
jgi:hypothetical protein